LTEVDVFDKVQHLDAQNKGLDFFQLFVTNLLMRR
jgi:hypothetical protein